MDKNQFNILTSKLDTLTKLYAFNLMLDKPIKDKIKILDNAGLHANEIADILDRTENQVYVTLSNLRKARKEHKLQNSNEKT